MKAVDATRLDEAGYGARSTLDEQTTQSASEQCFDHRRRSNVSLVRRKLNKFDAGRRFDLRGAYENASRAVIGEPFATSRRPDGSITTRAGFFPSIRRTVNFGSSATIVPLPTTTASTWARMR
jgi:hypothetical protein